MDAPSQKQAVCVVTASVGDRRSRAVEEVGKILGEELRKAGCDVKRHVVVKGDTTHVRSLVTSISNDNEAEAIVLVGGTGFGPSDNVCDALDGLLEKHIEGFGEAYRRLLRNEIGVHAMLVRATAGVYNQCVVFAMNGSPVDIRLAMEVLIAPTLPEAVALAYGRPPPPRDA
jgi:molybdenum cofactor biosynthesis protein B